tara:strand:+ start:1910 stop:2644 length:735 start_codon:yes stop_codon:yes gene_type:complete
MNKYNKDSFYENSFGIFGCENQKLLLEVRKKISKISLKHGYKLKPRSFEKVSEVKLNDFTKKMNNELGTLNLDVINSFSKTIKKLCGSKIAVQKKPYIRVNCSHLNDTSIVAHTDFDFGRSPYGFNIWIPMFDVIKKSGIFVYSFLDSKKIYKDFKFDKKLDNHIKILKKNNLKKEFLKPKFSEAVILSNVNVHGSIREKKSYPRISINMHFQNVNDLYGEIGAEFFSFASYDHKTNQYRLVSV